MATTITDNKTTVPSIDGIPVEVHPGDRWPAPYRGSKYSVRRLAGADGKDRYRLVWARQDKLVHTPIPIGLIPLLRVSRPSITGSIRITSHREVLCKRLDPVSGLWVPYYIGMLDGDIEFEDTGVMNIKWKNGTLGSLSVSVLTYPKNLEASIDESFSKLTYKFDIII